MITWKYIGINERRKQVVGELKARTEKDVRRQLKAMGIRPQKITKPSILEVDLGELLVSRGLASPFKKVELLNFTRQFGVMLDAGVPILECLDILARSQKNTSFKKIIRSISDDVGGGSSLSEALKDKPGFNNIFINLVRAGEAGGVLGEVVIKLVEFMEKQEKTKKAVKNAMTYPAIVVCVGLGVVYALMAFVIPRFKGMIEGSGQKIPAITQFVIDASNFAQEYSLLMFVGGFITLMFLSYYIKTNTGKAIFDKIMISMPVFGNIVIKGNLSSFSRTLSLMINSGVPLIESLDICITSIDNSIIARDISKVRDSVMKGESMSAPFTRIIYFPGMIAQMIKVGEQTGGMNAMLNKISAIFEEDVDDAVSSMTKLIEPFVIIVLGGIIAGLLVAMYLPIFMSAGGTT